MNGSPSAPSCQPPWVRTAFRAFSVPFPARDYYGELVRLADADGVVDLEPSSLARRMGASERTLRRWDLALARASLIRRSQTRDFESGGSSRLVEVLHFGRERPPQGQPMNKCSSSSSGRMTLKSSLESDARARPASEENIDALVEEARSALGLRYQFLAWIRRQLAARLARTSAGWRGLVADVRGLIARALQTGRNPAAVFVAVLKANTWQAVTLAGTEAEKAKAGEGKPKPAEPVCELVQDLGQRMKLSELQERLRVALSAFEEKRDRIVARFGAAVPRALVECRPKTPDGARRASRLADAWTAAQFAGGAA